jgi:Immunity protein 26
MGWFESGKAAGVILGDEPLDLTYDFLKQLAEVYQDGCERKPTLEEVRTTLEMVLINAGEEYVGDLAVREVTAVTIKTAKKRKSQPYKQGDVLAIPIEGGRFAFGRLMLVSKSRGMLVEVFREVSDRKQLSPSILASGRLFHPLRFLANLRAGGDGIKSWRWTVVASDDGYAMTEKDWALEFKAPDPRGGWSAINMRDNKFYQLSDDQAARMEDTQFWSIEDVEDRIVEELKREERLSNAKADGKS